MCDIVVEFTYGGMCRGGIYPDGIYLELEKSNCPPIYFFITNYK